MDYLINFFQMKKYIFILTLVLGYLSITAQNPCVIYFEAKNVTSNSVEIDVKANGFTNVYGFQMYVKWNSSVLHKNSVVYINPAIGSTGFGGNELGEDILPVNWNETNGINGETLPNGAILFTVKYDFSGSPCDVTSMALTDPSPRISLITYSNDTEFPLAYNGSSFQIPGNCGNPTTQNGIGLIIGDYTAANGTEICVPITVDSFKNVSSLQFRISWDPTILSFVKVINTNGGPNALSQLNGNDTLTYIMDADNLSLPDGTTLMEICFNVIGNNGQMSPIDFIDFDFFEIRSQNQPVDYYLDNGKVTVGVVNNPVTFTLQNKKTDVASSVCVNVYGKNFKNIDGFQYVVKWDKPTMLNYKGLGSVNKINITSDNINTYGNDAIKITWNYPTPLTKPDNDTLFQLCYDMVGVCGDSSNIIFTSGTPNFPIEVSVNGQPVPYAVNPGKVKIECSINYTAAVTNTTCNDYSDGKIIVTLASNLTTSEYNFKWFKVGSSTPILEGQGKNSLLGVKAGNYYVVITKISNPTNTITTETFQISQPDIMTISGTVSNINCTNNGSISISVTGGNSPYSYAWSLGSIGNTPNASNLQSGAYTVSVTDNKQCPSVNKAFTVGSDIIAMNVTGTLSNSKCNDSKDGQISLTVTGGCEPYTINWSDGLNQNQKVRTSLDAGSYSATVTDVKGTNITKTFNITKPSAIDVTGTSTQANPAKIEITATGGTPTYTYSWSGPNGYTSSSEDPNNITVSGTYIVTVTDRNGCTKTASFDVKTTYTVITWSVSIDSTQYNGYGIKCKGECNGFINATIQANKPYKVYLDGAEITLPYNGVCEGSHVLKVVDAENLTVEKPFKLTAPDALKVSVKEVNCENSGKGDGSIELKVTGGVPTYSFDWGIPGTTGIIASDLVKGNYEAKVTDKNGCSVSTGIIEVKSCDKTGCFQGTLVVTPNADGYNDYFQIKCGEDLTNNYLYIYDRIGNLVFSQPNYDGSWQGLSSSGNELPENGYMWVFTGKDETGAKQVYKGTVTLLR